jgi:hypothetical protein
MIAGVPVLAEPLEFLDLEHANSVTLALTSFQQGQAAIHPKAVTPRATRIYMDQNGLTEPPAPGTPITNWVPVLRVFGARIDKPSPLSYWDISSKTLQANLLPRLIANQGGTLTVTLTANGVKPTKRYSVEQG